MYQLFEWIYPNEAIKDLPEISLYEFLKSAIQGRSFDERHKEQMEGPLMEHGAARLGFLGKWELIISDPISIKHILNRTVIFLKKSENGDISLGLLGKRFFGSSNIVNNDNEEWKRHRKIVNPAFKKRFPPELFGECTLEMISIIKEAKEEPVSVNSLFQKLTLDIFGKGLFSYDFQSLKKGENNNLLIAYNDVIDAVFNPVYILIPFLEHFAPWRSYYHDQADQFRSFLKDLIKERQIEISCRSAKDDLLTLMLKNRLESKEASLTDEELVNNIVTFFLAGHDTTANTLTSTLYYLAKHPEIQSKARKEVYEILGNSNNIFPTLEQQKQMIYMNLIIKETMRIITTVPGLRRYCSKDEILPNGVFIPRGTTVNVELWMLHHNPTIFLNPDVFDPDRFLDPQSKQSSFWMPFSNGTRLCIGMNFSLMEQRIVLSLLLQRFKFELGPNSKTWVKPKLPSLGLLYPKDLDIIFKPINSEF